MVPAEPRAAPPAREERERGRAHTAMLCAGSARGTALCGGAASAGDLCYSPAKSSTPAPLHIPARQSWIWGLFL